MKKLLISACLVGENCKYSGGNNLLPAEVLESLEKAYQLIPVCPERDGGLPVPRTPAERVGCRVNTQSGLDVTEEYIKGAQKALAAALKFECEQALLKARSPSCGKGLIYDGTFSHSVTEGNGVAAELLINNGIEVYDETEIKDLL